MLSSPRGCAKYTSQHSEFLSCQRFLSLSSSFKCDGSFSDEFVAVVFKVNCDGKITMLSKPDSIKFRFRNLPRFPTIQRLFISDIHFSPNAPSARPINKSSTCIPMTPFQLTVIKITTSQTLISRHGFPTKLRKFLRDNHHARCADVRPKKKDFIRRTHRAGFPSESENKYPTSGGALIVNS